MTVTDAKILTTETIPQYLQERLSDLTGVIDSTEGLTVQTIAGGNVNYAFCMTTANGKTVFLKQAPEFVAIFGPDGLPLTSERMQREMNVYQEWKDMLGSSDDAKYLPQIHYFDKTHMVVIMEFLQGHELLDHIIVDSPNVMVYPIHTTIATCLGDFMGQVHSQTHSSKVDEQRRKFLTSSFENREMRDIQLEFVFTKCYKEATEEQRAGLQLTPAFMKEVELLKQQYNGTAPQQKHLVLTHGDLHPGSVMVDKTGSTKVIDPEFTVYGPPGLDVGSLLSGYCLGAIHQAFSKEPQAVARIIQGARALWESYAAALKTGGIADETAISEIAIESVGFTVAEVCRTALEFAGGRKWLQFEDASVKAASSKAALQLVDKCMIARHTGGIELLFTELEAVCAAVDTK